MADEAVVIVDARGTEHEFPAGFDPVKAAGIVRAQAGGTETGDYARAFAQSLRQTATDTGAAALDAVTATLSPTAWLQAMQAKQAAENPSEADLARLVQDANAPRSLRNIPDNVAARVQAAKDEVTNLSTPEGGGQAIGNLAVLLAAGRAGEVAAKIPRPSASMVPKAVVEGVRLVRHPVRSIVTRGVDELLKRYDARTAAAAEPAAATAKPPVTPVGKSPQQLLNEEALAARRATPAAPPAPVDEFTAARTAKLTKSPDAPAVPPPDGPVVKASGQMQLTAPEFKEFQRLVKRGLKLPDALEAVRNMRALAAQLGGASPAEVAKAVAHRETTGAW